MNQETRKDIALLVIRLAFGIRLIYGSIDNITDWDRMLEFQGFLAAKGFPLPLLCAVVSVYAQFFTGLSWIAGYKVRIFSLLMILNFIVAIVGAHLLAGDSYLNTAPAIHLLAVSFLIYFMHAGRYSVDSYLESKRKKADPSQGNM
ncbi:DoxX family protein [Sinomicrobium weinanense]|uniref:DoxX family protein n=1 Tax=Sinomicrobium weinanense TaxID=2842200 RepID=A0A926JQ21_9FLAO|nr:DoxX family membrane protein [Sinomicrobium weinanense]MBC9795156.1 DoxX family protein [Sinomicrobium weinanense]MBU3121933.1 DoxX family membrane protein [Sinomicrobium weinanense]